ncbi:hypothetical protein DL95DRAFT_38537 [Leptodontidium sp. 2 PMI_412]|nr:hypothetical protein DL95DRAFT_38537 [Leptodontidium sp. 2 PMI_412]
MNDGVVNCFVLLLAVLTMRSLPCSSIVPQLRDRFSRPRRILSGFGAGPCQPTPLTDLLWQRHYWERQAFECRDCVAKRRESIRIECLATGENLGVRR